MKLLIDFESRSRADLPAVGQHLYARHSSTEVLCLGWKVIGEGEAKVLTMPGVYTDDPSETKEFKYAVKHAEFVVAHNAPFEQAMWKHCLLPTTTLGASLPYLPPEKWLCTLSMASILALPRSLENAGNALNLKIKKDVEARKLLLKMCKPRKPIQNIKAWIEWVETDDALKRLYEYCRTDIVTEEFLFEELTKYRVFTEKERELWVLDQKINQRGFYIDKIMVENILRLIKQEESELSKELHRKTFYQVTTVKQTKAFRDFLLSQGFDIPNMQKATVDSTIEQLEKLNSPANSEVLDVLKIRQSLGMSSTSKYQAFLDRVDDDNRVRDNLMFHGASTGRFCLTGDTEFFNGEKWVRFDSVRKSKINVLCFNPELKKYETRLCVLNVFDTGGMGYEGRSDKFPFIFTKDHKWKSKGGAITLKCSNKPAYVEKAVKGSLVSDKPKMNDIQTRTLVMVQADGSYTKDMSKGVYLKLGFKKERKIERCRYLLKAQKINFSEKEHSDGKTVISILCKRLPKYLQNFADKKFNKYSYDLKSFFEEVVLWDGHQASKNCIEYSTCDKDNADFVTMLGACSGYSVSIKSRNRNKKWNTNYRIFITDKQTIAIDKRAIRTKHIKEPVYCPTTPYGFFLIRRKGVVSLTGNSGTGVQPQNFPRGRVKMTKEIFDDIAEGDLHWLRLLYGRPMDLFSSALRGVIRATPGFDLYCGDFNAIEARVLLWLAGETKGLKEYEDGVDAYRSMASVIYQIPIEKIDEDQRFLGKSVILGCGYQMGRKKFAETVKASGRDLAESIIERAHAAFREKYPLVPKLWSNYENAAIYAVQNKGKRIKINRVSWYVEKDFLFAELPSGRRLAYYKPQIRNEETPWGELRPKLYVWTTDSKTKQWVQRAVYGGLLTENISQAVSRDCMAEAMFRTEDAGYRILITVHDELLNEKETGTGSLQEFTALMSARPEWAPDLPLKVGSWTGKQYKK